MKQSPEKAVVTRSTTIVAIAVSTVRTAVTIAHLPIAAHLSAVRTAVAMTAVAVGVARPALGRGARHWRGSHTALHFLLIGRLLVWIEAGLLTRIGIRPSVVKQ